MNNKSAMPTGISVIYFDDSTKNIYAELPLDNEQAKKLSKRIYKSAMTALSAEHKVSNPQTDSDSGNST